MTIRFNRAIALALVVPLAALLVLGTGVPPASAHDSVLSTSPGDTEQLTSAPSTVTMAFSDDILQIGAILLVVDEEGTNWAEGGPALDGPQASQAVAADLPEGDYQVRWRVVSADGHPISGTFDFGVGSTDSVFTSTSTTAPQESAPPRPAPDTEAGTDAELAAGSPAGVPIALIGAIGALTGLGLFFLAHFLLRRLRADSSTRTSASSTTGNTPTRSDTIE